MENSNRNYRNRNFPDQYGDYDRDWRQRDFRNRNYDHDRYNPDRNYHNPNVYGNPDAGYDVTWNQNYNSGDYSANTNRWENEYRRNSGYPASEYDREYDRNSGSRRGDYNNYRDYDNYRNYVRNRDWWDRTSDEVASWFGDDEAERRRQMDKMYGPHKGKGPKGYTRSDEKIRGDIDEKLYHDSFIDASDIEVKVTDGNVTLTGTVENRATKRRTEDIAEEVAGVKDVYNNLKIKKADPTASDVKYSNKSYQNGRKQASHA